MKSPPLFLCFFLLVFTILIVNAQLKIGHNPTEISPHALLELESYSKGLILPRMTSKQRDAAFDQSTPVGTTIFNTDLQQVQYFTKQGASNTGDVLSWTAVSSGEVLMRQPENPRSGQLYYDALQKLLLFWSGELWVPIGGPSVVENATEQKLSVSPLTEDHRVFFSLSETNTQSLDLSSLSNTDNQNISNLQFDKRTNVLRVGISNGESQKVDLSTLDDDGSDDQRLQVTPLNASNTFSIEIERGNSETIDLSALVNNSLNSGTDSQTLTISPLSSLHIVTFSVSNGNTTTLDLDELANTGTDSQTLYLPSLDASNTLTLSISNGNTQTIDLSSLDQPPFFRLNGTTIQSRIGTSTHDFVLGSDQLNNQIGSADDARLIFDKSKAAFRVGYASGNSWDDINIGDRSIAMGYRTQASGDRTIALGNSTEAHSYAETVFGSYNTLVVPQSTSVWNQNDRLFVLGNGSSYANKSDAIVVLKNGNVGIGDSTPTEATLVVSGSIVASGNISSNQILTPDYVFDFYFDGFSTSNPSYRFLSLEQIKQFIAIHHHLPNVPSAEEIMAQGGVVFNHALKEHLEKIEELFLYVIEQDEKIRLLEEELQSTRHQLGLE